MLPTLSAICGWIYVTCWSISYYPQIYLNMRRQSLTGVSLDYLLGNVLGAFLLFIYYQFLFSHTPTQLAYRRRHEGWENTIQLNDVVMALHAFVLSTFLYLQAIYYKKPGDPIMSFSGKTFLSCLALVALAALLLFAFSFLEWLDVLYLFSAMKFVITLFKYAPQVFFLIFRLDG
jgi:cystinosin